jgi:hypothetical protein
MTKIAAKLTSAVALCLVLCSRAAEVGTPRLGGASVMSNTTLGVSYSEAMVQHQVLDTSDHFLRTSASPMITRALPAYRILS